MSITTEQFAFYSAHDPLIRAISPANLSIVDGVLMIYATGLPQLASGVRSGTATKAKQLINEADRLQRVAGKAREC